MRLLQLIGIGFVLGIIAGLPAWFTGANLSSASSLSSSGGAVCAVCSSLSQNTVATSNQRDLVGVSQAINVASLVNPVSILNIPTPASIFVGAVPQSINANAPFYALPGEFCGPYSDPATCLPLLFPQAWPSPPVWTGAAQFAPSGTALQSGCAGTGSFPSMIFCQPAAPLQSAGVSLASLYVPNPYSLGNIAL